MWEGKQGRQCAPNLWNKQFCNVIMLTFFFILLVKYTHFYKADVFHNFNLFLVNPVALRCLFLNCFTRGLWFYCFCSITWLVWSYQYSFLCFLLYCRAIWNYMFLRRAAEIFLPARLELRMWQSHLRHLTPLGAVNFHLRWNCAVNLITKTSHHVVL